MDVRMRDALGALVAPGGHDQQPDWREQAAQKTQNAPGGKLNSRASPGQPRPRCPRVDACQGRE
jgi:hypothetical protein